MCFVFAVFAYHFKNSISSFVTISSKKTDKLLIIRVFVAKKLIKLELPAIQVSQKAWIPSSFSKKGLRGS